MTESRDWSPASARRMGLELGAAEEGTRIRPVLESEWLEREPALALNARRWLEAQGFRGNPGTFAYVPDGDGMPGEVWLGIATESAVGDIARLSGAASAGRYHVQGSEGAGGSALGWDQIVIGWALGNYGFDLDGACSDAKAVLHVPDIPEVSTALNRAAAIRLTRDLINVPAQDLGPASLSAAAQSIAARFGSRAEEIVGEALLKRNFPAVHAVGRAGAELPRLVDFRWGSPDHPMVTLVGKGVCFDTGGLNVKPMAGMRHMKRDMGGAAVVLGLAQLIMSEALPVNLRVLLPIVENAIAGNAMRPGDVVSTRDGTTIEIENTDCEGRMILADALTAASEDDPDLVIDCATLTGSARTAFGGEIQALFASDDALGQTLQASSIASGDPLWHMPLWPGYRKRIDAPVGDLLNMAPGGYAGAITAALFLAHFARETRAWVHLDMSAWNDSPQPGCPVGGEATGLNALFDFLRARYGS